MFQCYNWDILVSLLQYRKCYCFTVTILDILVLMLQLRKCYCFSVKVEIFLFQCYNLDILVLVLQFWKYSVIHLSSMCLWSVLLRGLGWSSWVSRSLSRSKSVCEKENINMFLNIALGDLRFWVQILGGKCKQDLLSSFEHD